MKRRNFLKFFAAPAAIVAVPAIVAARPEEKPEPISQPQITDTTIKHILESKISACEHFQGLSHNGAGWEAHVSGPCVREEIRPALTGCMYCHGGVDCQLRQDAKVKASEYWEERSHKLAIEIEMDASLLGFSTIWPGMRPEFVPIERV